jgi:nucleoside-diphosphate kinase
MVTVTISKAFGCKKEVLYMKTYSFLIFKPDALERELVSNIIGRFINNGFTLEIIDYKKVNRDLILQHYTYIVERMGDVFVKRAEDFFVNKFVIIAIVSIENNNAISLSRKLVGILDPVKSENGTIRYDFGDDSLEKASNENRCVRNLVHASDDITAYNREVLLWFGKDILKNYLQEDYNGIS